MPGHVSQVPDYSSCVPHIISVVSVGPWIAAVGLLCLWRGGKSLDWTGEAGGLTGGRAHLAT